MFIMAAWNSHSNTEYYFMLSYCCHPILTAHNWQKWKSTFLTFHRHEIYTEEAVGLKKFQLYFKNYDFCEYVIFGAISLKIDIL